MMAIVEQMEIVRYEDYEETMDSFKEEEDYNGNMYGKGYQGYRRGVDKQMDYNNQSTQYYPV